MSVELPMSVAITKFCPQTSRTPIPLEILIGFSDWPRLRLESELNTQPKSTNKLTKHNLTETRDAMIAPFSHQ